MCGRLGRGRGGARSALAVRSHQTKLHAPQPNRSAGIPHASARRTGAIMHLQVAWVSKQTEHVHALPKAWGIETRWGSLQCAPSAVIEEFWPDCQAVRTQLAGHSPGDSQIGPNIGSSVAGQVRREARAGLPLRRGAPSRACPGRRVPADWYLSRVRWDQRSGGLATQRSGKWRGRAQILPSG